MTDHELERRLRTALITPPPTTWRACSPGVKRGKEL